MEFIERPYSKKTFKPPLFFWFLLPTFLLIAFFLVYPTIYQLYLSFFSTTLYSSGSFVGLKNYLQIIKDSITHDSAKITLAFVGLSTLFEVIWGFILAIAFNSITKGKKFLRGIIIIPLMLTPVAVGSIWNLMYFPEGGVINTIFRFFRISQQIWLASPMSALFSLVLFEF
ncbi:MAG: sugar ABC transporter permease [Bacteroidia bacterium]|nr:sugar ABC transporter permease [Bacteroidia bacterium]